MMQTPYSFYYILSKADGLDIYQMLKCSEPVASHIYSLTLVCVNGGNSIAIVAGFTNPCSCEAVETMIEKHLDILQQDDNQDL